MNKEYMQPWFDRRNWLLSHMQDGWVTTEEMMALLMIDYMKECEEELGIDPLAKRMNTDRKTTESILSSLQQKGYLTIELTKKRLIFNIEGIFFQEKKTDQLSLETTFETEFGRVLSDSERQQLIEWENEYDAEMVLYALREAAIYRKMNFKYIGAILKDWVTSGYTMEDLLKR
ncbi:MAG: DnaD domain protein [Erysipelotrichaceae bacterium]|nr:DnaD domain protein [Erysipelotrichaceae bacterium]